MAKKVYLKGEEFVFTKVKGSSETDYREGDVNINPTNIGLGSVNNTSDKDKPVSTAQQKAIDVAYANSNKYTDQKIANLINGAPETMDTLKEISDAISKSKSTEEALNKAIGTKANQTELDTHTGNDTIHITASEREKWNKNGGVIGVRGSAESDYKTGQVTISKEDIGLGNVDNTTDANKSVKYATSAGSASTSAKVSNKLTIASPINSYNDLYFRDEIVTEAIQYDGSSAMTVNLMNVRSDSYQNTVKFTSNDSTTGDSTAPSLLKSGETHASIFSKVSTIFKNVRWLLSKMGTTDISSLGDGTITGALSTLNSNMNNIILSYPSMDIVSLITNYVTNDNLPLYSLRVFILVSSQGTYQAIICRSNTTWFSGIIIPATSQESNKWVFNAIIGSPGTYSLF